MSAAFGTATLHAMGFFDKAKRWLGMSSDDASTEEAAAPDAAARPAPKRPNVKDGRPALRDDVAPASAGPTLDDALAARDAGDREESRRILREIDRGGGLRTVLRAAAALEAEDESEVRDLLAAIDGDEPRWKLCWQLACAFDDPAEGAPWLERAKERGAPAWALAYARALSRDAEEQRRGLVDLLFADAALARTVAARDLSVAGAVADADAVARWAALSHGRDAIRRFGVRSVAAVLDRAASGGRR